MTEQNAPAGPRSGIVVRLPAATRRLHREILSAFAASGHAPAPADLAQAAHLADADVANALAELAGLDIIALSTKGELRAAYPFSPAPTRHQVRIDAGPQVYAMCAIDALGVSAMTGRRVTITSEDPETGSAISVAVDGSHATWDPDTAVVFAGARADQQDVPSVDRTCGTINFFATASAAQRWAAQHPAITGRVLGLDQALAAGIAEFGQLMKPEG